MNVHAPAIIPARVRHEVNIPEAFDYLWDDDARYLGAYGGRGSAKSHSIAGVLVVKAYKKSKLVLCGREIQNSISESSKALIEKKIREYGFGYFFDITDKYIRGANGSRFLFKGLRTNASAIMSMEGVDIAWIAQAETISKNSLNILRPTLRNNSQMYFDWNPKKPEDPVNELLRNKDLPPRAIVREVSYKDNPYFPDELREEMEFDRRRSPEIYRHIWLGEYLKHTDAQVFKNWRQAYFDTPTDAHFRYGADWGYANDPTTLVRIFKYPIALVEGVDPKRTLYVDREAYKVGCEIDKTPELFDTIDNKHARGWPIRADSARPDTISYMKRNGYPRIVGATKGPGSVEDGVSFLQSFDLIVHPQCKHTVDELTLYSFKVVEKTEEILPILADKHNNVIDAMRYAAEQDRKHRRYSLDNVG